MTPPSNQHSLSDWLQLHELSQATCRSLLDAMPLRSTMSGCYRRAAEPDGTVIDVDTAWGTAVEAMRAFFPAQKDIIDLAFANTTRLLVARRQGSRKAVTVDNGANTYPTILYSFAGEPADQLVLAHEFAHALQIVASEGRFVSPVMRETCAFLGEHTLLAHIASLDAMQHHCLTQVWNADNQKYFGSGKRRLAAALSQPDQAYSYAWNYPMARYLGVQAQSRLTPTDIWALFEGHVTVAGLLRDLGVQPA
ncbi:MAG: hypothetical protein P0Y65_19680 [Candidatus Devosia phytovorans]|uniref:Uncharacterized protein n=1 Tax=Candidatus Devosia phytovorans TaxID=3121372 RepID=A0AAJ6AZ98_9HYPH|nr:hypothetical protein [Devosia sp.]WEK04370.1 MAG: hypothetical protein P0Y65_19680 [Devosia sp.]